jgi:hypothetical protein
MCSTVSPNEMIGRGLALAGKSFHFARAAVGGDGTGRLPCVGTGPHAATRKAMAMATLDFAMFS